MNKAHLFSLAGCSLAGLVVGVLWSPLKKEDSRTGLADSGQSSRSLSAYSQSNRSASTTPARSDHPGSRSASSGKRAAMEELTRDSIFALLKRMDEEETQNPMEIARMAALFASLTESEATNLLLDLLEPDEDNRQGVPDFIIDIVFSRLCEVNGPAAMELAARRMAEDNDWEKWIAHGMLSWVAADPDGARAWVGGELKQIGKLIEGGNEEPELTGTAAIFNERTAMESYLRAMGENDAEGLREHISGIENELIRDSLQNESLRIEAKQTESVERLEALLAQTNDSNEGTQARLEIITRMAALDADQAAREVVQLPTSELRDRMVTAVAMNLMNSDPAAGADWYAAQDLVLADSRRDRLQRIAYSWGGQDYEAAASWILEQPNNATRDFAETSLAHLAANREDWQTSLSWLRDVSDDSARERNFEQIYNNLSRRTNGRIPEVFSEAAQENGFGDHLGEE